MNILEYIKQGGTCKSKAGHFVRILQTDFEEEYPIKGQIVMNKFDYDCKWTKEGTPHNLPLTHCLDLVPVIPVITYKSVNKGKLSKYDNIDDFYTHEG